MSHYITSFLTNLIISPSWLPDFPPGLIPPSIISLFLRNVAHALSPALFLHLFMQYNTVIKYTRLLIGQLGHPVIQTPCVVEEDLHELLKPHVIRPVFDLIKPCK